MGSPSRRAVLWALALIGAAACAAPASPGPAAVDPGRPATASDGVYTSAQAERGRLAYSQECSSCHAPDLRGNSNAPSLVGVSFLFLWEDRPLGELYALIRNEMPTNAPNSLPEQTYLDILSYLLSVNGFPSGGQELPRDAGSLDTIMITDRASAPGTVPTKEKTPWAPAEA